jgi:RNA polymerase sigma-70 factor (ECF subfamily)
VLDDSEIRTLLLQTAARGAPAAVAFRRLYTTTAPLLLAVALRIVRRRELAEEVLHDAFTRIWHNAAQFDPGGAPMGWITAIVRNRAIDLMASHDMARVDSYHATRDPLIDDDPDGALDRLFDWSGNAAADPGESVTARLDSQRAHAHLRGCLDGLPAPQRQSLTLAYTHGLSHAELAEHLGKPMGTVKTWIRRGMDSLRQCVEACLQGAR